VREKGEKGNGQVALPRIVRDHRRKKRKEAQAFISTIPTDIQEKKKKRNRSLSQEREKKEGESRLEATNIAWEKKRKLLSPSREEEKKKEKGRRHSGGHQGKIVERLIGQLKEDAPWLCVQAARVLSSLQETRGGGCCSFSLG